MTKQSSTFHFEEKYITNSGKEKKVTVVLTVNYLTKNYTIKSFDSIDGKFNFFEDSHEWRRWKAELKCINQAIDFTNKELGIK